MPALPPHTMMSRSQCIQFPSGLASRSNSKGGRAITCSAGQVDGASTPAAHDEDQPTVKPIAQVAWHVDPKTRVDVPSPAPPFAGALPALHGSAWQVTGASAPAAHDEEPLTMGPRSRVTAPGAAAACARPSGMKEKIHVLDKFTTIPPSACKGLSKGTQEQWISPSRCCSRWQRSCP